MSVFQRLRFPVFVAMVAMVAVFVALRPPPAHGAPMITAPCLPNIGGSHGMLPNPPRIDVKQNQTITMSVLQGPTGPKATPRYCYVLDGSPAQYVEAPTIAVRQGATFTLNLIDKIPLPKSSGSMTMAPEPQMTAPDGCSLMPYDGPMPAPNATGYLGHKRVYVPMPMTVDPPNDTNFHTHGWHVSPDVDNVFVSLARSGGHCSYTFIVPLTQPAGTYWYHAHMHGIAGPQVGGGLAGALIVLPAAPPASPSLPDRVILLKNSTYAIDSAPANRVLEARLAIAQLHPSMKLAAPARPHAIDPFNPPAWPSGWPIASGASRCIPSPQAFMSHWVINGYPVGDPEVRVAPPVAMLAPGTRELYRIVDAMSDSYANIELFDASGKRENLDVVGRDGVPIGKNASDENIVAPFTNVLLPPAGRVDIVVTGASGPQTLVAGNVCTGYLGERIPVRNLLVIKPTLSANAALPHALAPLRMATAQTSAASALHALPESAITKRRAITFTQYTDKTDPSKDMAWYVTDTSDNPAGFIEHPFWLSPDPKNPNKYLPEIDVPQNSIEEWTLVNASGEIHAFHIHQLTFVTMSNPEFEGPHVPVFQDTVALPPATIDAKLPPNPPFPWLTPSKTIIRIDFRHVNKGTFVFHCHMLFHEDRGMMAIVRVY